MEKKEGNITVNINEVHIHMQERTDIHNFFPDGTGGLAEAGSEPEDDRVPEPDEGQEPEDGQVEASADFEKKLGEIGAAVIGLMLAGGPEGRTAHGIKGKGA